MNIFLLCPTSNPDTYRENLGRSPDIHNGKISVIKNSEPLSAPEKLTIMLNRLISEKRATEGDFIACVHEDVYLHEGFVEDFIDGAHRASAERPSMRLFGVAGADWSYTPTQRRVSKVWSNLMDKDVWVDNLPERGYHPVLTLDECFIGLFMAGDILSWLNFGISLSGKHLYGANMSLGAPFESCVVRAHWLEHRSKQERVVMDPMYYLDLGRLYERYGELTTTCVTIQKNREDSEIVRIGPPELAPHYFETREECEENARRTRYGQIGVV